MEVARSALMAPLLRAQMNLSMNRTPKMRSEAMAQGLKSVERSVVWRLGFRV